MSPTKTLKPKAKRKTPPDAPSPRWRSWELPTPVMRIVDDTEPLIRMPSPEMFARAMEQATREIIVETYNRLKGRVD